MKIVENRDEAYAQVSQWRQQGCEIGLVPTMGALHEGHLSLANRSVGECDKTLASIFVNPTQFGPSEDFSKYPRTLDRDIELLTDCGVDLLFVPGKDELYPESFSTFVEPPELAKVLEGEFRPGHFRGVTTVVLKLFNVLPAHRAYFGQKDYQQLAVIKKMVRDLDVPVNVVGCETVRDIDGLALSSRNRYLNPEEREKALSISRALRQVESMVTAGETNVELLEQQMTAQMTGVVKTIQYARVVDAETLQSIESLNHARSRAVALIAAYVGNTRLIDNLEL